jgi:hypothetical protein
MNTPELSDLRYRTPVAVNRDGYLPNISLMLPRVFGHETKPVTFSGRGQIEFPLPESETDPVWVRLNEYPHPVMGYERNEIHTTN